MIWRADLAHPGRKILEFTGCSQRLWMGHKRDSFANRGSGSHGKKSRSGLRHESCFCLRASYSTALILRQHTTSLCPVRDVELLRVFGSQ